MGKKYKLLLFALIILGLIITLVINLTHADVLNPKGIIAQKEYDLLIFATLLMLVIVIPVFIMTFTIAWKYREGNKKARYSPDWSGSRLYESIWWGFPLVIILILSIVAWQSSHDLHPFKPIKSDTKPMTIQVVALQWKWLFIYPEQKIATINFVQMPVNTPIRFEITADAPMNSFWIPSLGGQIYAMSGMSTELNLIADKPGNYRGSSANISGEGFSGMKFIAKSTSNNDFNKWFKDAQSSSHYLDMVEYIKLAKPSKNNPVAYYSLADEDLYNKIMAKYIAPVPDSSHKHMQGTE